MANKCPNKSSIEWKLLEKALGEDGAMSIFIANNEELPSINMVEQIINLHEKSQVKGTQSEVDKIVKEIKDTDKTA